MTNTNKNTFKKYEIISYSANAERLSELFTNPIDNAENGDSVESFDSLHEAIEAFEKHETKFNIRRYGKEQKCHATVYTLEENEYSIDEDGEQEYVDMTNTVWKESEPLKNDIEKIVAKAGEICESNEDISIIDAVVLSMCSESNYFQPSNDEVTDCFDSDGELDDFLNAHTEDELMDYICEHANELEYVIERLSDLFDSDIVGYICDKTKKYRMYRM